MAQLRLIGDPGELDELLEAIRGVVHVADVSRRPSRYDPGEIRIYAHAAPVVDGEIAQDPAGAPRPAAPRAGGAVGRRPRKALAPGSQ
jgi:hypothetical protein